MINDGDPFAELKRRLSTPDETWAVVPQKIRKRQQHFVRVPWTWVERLVGASGQTHQVALHLLYLNWKGRGAPVKLPNGMLKFDGVSPYSKRRAINELEQRGLITVERHPRRSPIIQLLLI